MRNLRTSLLMLGIFSLLLGIIYPLAITGLAQLFFPFRANGSIIGKYKGQRTNDEVPVGSALIGQQFSSARYFHGRPSECGYDASHSAGLNLGPTNPALLARVRALVDSIRTEERLPEGTPVPADLVLASGSGLDPDISPEAALLQVRRAARARGLDTAAVRTLVMHTVEPPFLGIFGLARVNVLRLNLALDSMSGEDK